MSRKTQKPYASVPLKKQLVILFAAVLIPALLFQIFLSLSWVRSRYNLQLDNNREIARTLEVSFQRFVKDIERAEQIVGRSVLTLAPQDRRLADQLLRNAAQNFPSVAGFLLLDTNGVVIAGSSEVAGTDMSDAHFVQSLSEQDSVYVSDLVFDVYGNEPGFVISSIVTAGPEWPSGIVVGYVNPDFLGELTLGLDRPYQGNYVLYDSEGTLVYSDIHKSVADSLRTDFGEDDELLGQALRGDVAVGQVRHFDEDMHRIAVFIPADPYGWVVGATEPRSVVYRPVIEDIVFSLIGIIAVVVITLWFGLRVISKVLKSVSQLQKHARLVGQGDYTHKTQPSGIDEFDSLFSEFNTMGEQLRRRDEAVRERTDELQRSNQELEQFAYVASHDLQEPLRTIAGYLQLIERRYKGKLDNDADEFITFAVEGAHRLGNIINDLLAYSRVGTRGKPFKEFDSGVAVQGVVKTMKAAMDSSGTEVLKGELPVIKADPSQFRQLVQNLISNSIKFRHPDRSPRIQIDAAETDGEWRFSFKDNGIGFETQYSERVFAAFKRLHTQDKYPGSGIGLAICRKIIQRHGGRIWAESVPGEGTTFYFTIPERNDHV
ncbi:MAG: ATP-binding protein [Chitinispirillaceae bacterium]